MLYFFIVAEKFLLNAIIFNFNVPAIDPIASFLYCNRFSIVLRFSFSGRHVEAATIQACRRAPCAPHSSDNETNENLNHRDVKYPGMRNGCAHPRSSDLSRPLFACVARRPSGDPPFSTAIIPESRDYASPPRGTFSGTTPAAHRIRYAYGSRIARSNLAVRPFPAPVGSDARELAILLPHGNSGQGGIALVSPVTANNGCDGNSR